MLPVFTARHSNSMHQLKVWFLVLSCSVSAASTRSFSLLIHEFSRLCFIFVSRFPLSLFLQLLLTLGPSSCSWFLSFWPSFSFLSIFPSPLAYCFFLVPLFSFRSFLSSFLSFGFIYFFFNHVLFSLLTSHSSVLLTLVRSRALFLSFSTSATLLYHGLLYSLSRGLLCSVVPAPLIPWLSSFFYVAAGLSPPPHSLILPLSPAALSPLVYLSWFHVLPSEELAGHDIKN